VDSPALPLAALITIPFAAILTFSLIFDPALPDASASGSVVSTGLEYSGLSTGTEHDAPGSLNFAESLSRSFNLLISLWFMGVLLFTLRMTGGLIFVTRLRTRGVDELADEWIHRFDRIKLRTGLRKGIRFLQSKKIQVPTAMGILKPVILIPASMLSGLPTEELEAVVAHELAHIRRLDYLVNILQTLIETLFFYHPAVWMISALVRNEREKCCDDIAVDVCGRISVYARALTGVGAMGSHLPRAAVALIGSKNQILHRVERLINQKKMKNNANERWIAGLVIVAAVLVIGISTGAALSNISTSTTIIPKTVNAELMQAETELIPSPDTSLHLDIQDNVVTREFHNMQGEDRVMKFVIREGRLQELYVNGEKVPESDFPEYQKETTRTMEDLQAIEKSIQEAMQRIQEMDFSELEEKMRHSLKNIEHQHFYFDQEKKSLEEMISELEKLELEEK